MAKHVLRYIHGTDDYGLKYKKNDKFIFSRYMDAYYGGSLDDRRSMIGYMFFLGSGLISWGNKKKRITSKYTTNLEYHAIGDAICEVVWLCHILTNIGIPQKQAIVMHYDNQDVLKLV